ncbi:MAG: peroxiredoxin-like family protein [Pirellulales bacterium]
MNRTLSTIAIVACAALLMHAASLRAEEPAAAEPATAIDAVEPAAAKMPAVGDKARDFTLHDLAGRPVKLSALLETSPVVLVVLRGFPGYQCPICSFQVAGLMKHAQEIAAAGARVVFVYPGPADALAERAHEFIKNKTLPDHFSLVTDPDYSFTKSYGLRWDAPRETAYPSTFVIDRAGVIRIAKISKSHGDRAKVEDVLAALE